MKSKTGKPDVGIGGWSWGLGGRGGGWILYWSLELSESRMKSKTGKPEEQIGC